MLHPSTPYRIILIESKIPPLEVCLLFAKMVQNRNVSSPAPVTIVWPSGLIAKYNTREVCPVNAATWVIDGYFHTATWFWLYPCVLTNSFEFFDHAKLQTCDPVSISLTHCPFIEFQNRIFRSAVPPPEARMPRWWGDQDMAFTAAWWAAKA
jgi:hypothetical protein